MRQSEMLFVWQKILEMRGIEPRAFHMQSERSTTELHPLALNVFGSLHYRVLLSDLFEKIGLPVMSRNKASLAQR